jgi:hypothetical protein
LPFLFQNPKLEEEEAIQFAEFGAQVGAAEEKPDERSGSVTKLQFESIDCPRF